MSEKTAYDLLVIGAGPGGYVAAARAGQLGMKVACVDKSDRLGGVCLNVGCIPSKALLDSSEHVETAKKSFGDHGIRTTGLEIDLDVMMKRKDQVVSDLTDNVRTLLKANKVEIIQGTARFKSDTVVEIKDGSKKQEISAKHILLATGSYPVEIPGIKMDGRFIVSSTEALSFDKIPDRMVVVGGGSVGLEIGSIWSRLGTAVIVVEMLPAVVSRMDGQLSRRLLRILKNQGIAFRLKTRVMGIEKKKNRADVEIEDENGNREVLACDKVLVAIGRKPLTEGLGLENTGVELDENGFVTVGENFRTSVTHIYAIGDLIGGWMLAHEASAEGRAAVEGMAGKHAFVNYEAIPNIIYTFPEAASVGATEEALRALKIDYCTGTYPLTGAGRARCMGETEGFVKVLSNRETDRLLGIHIIAPRASDMIAEAVLAMEFGASSEDIGKIAHGHPTFAEALQEAALVSQQCSIYAG